MVWQKCEEELRSYSRFQQVMAQELGDRSLPQMKWSEPDNSDNMKGEERIVNINIIFLCYEDRNG